MTEAVDHAEGKKNAIREKPEPKERALIKIESLLRL